MPSTTVTVDVDVDLSDFGDDDIKEEYEERFGAGANSDPDMAAELQRAYQHHHAGRRDMAYEILWRMCLVRLNKIV